MHNCSPPHRCPFAANGFTARVKLADNVVAVAGATTGMALAHSTL